MGWTQPLSMQREAWQSAGPHEVAKAVLRWLAACLSHCCQSVACQRVASVVPQQ